MNKEVVPKVSISYSWTDPNHEDWVITLATRLMEEHGIDVILDKWDLKFGQDKNYFMEKMLDSDKVLIICEHGYKEKADSRNGGVGIETQIISPEVYSKIDCNKFIPIIRETGDTFDSYMPSYLKNRLGIDMSNDIIFEKGLEDLVRDIVGQPKYKKPNLGKLTNYSEETLTSLILPISDHNESFPHYPFSILLDDTELDVFYDEIRYTYEKLGVNSLIIDFKEETRVTNLLIDLKKKPNPTLDDRRNIIDISDYLNKIIAKKQQLLDMIHLMITDKPMNYYIDGKTKGKLLKGLVSLSLSPYSGSYFGTKINIYNDKGYSFGIDVADTEYELLSEKMKPSLLIPHYNYASELPKQIILEKVIPAYILDQYICIKTHNIDSYSDFNIYSFYCGLG